MEENLVWILCCFLEEVIRNHSLGDLIYPLVWDIEQNNYWGLWDVEMGLTDLEDEVTLLSICLLVPLA
jgi:hypothetical protein